MTYFLSAVLVDKSKCNTVKTKKFGCFSHLRKHCYKNDNDTIMMLSAIDKSKQQMHILVNVFHILRKIDIIILSTSFLIIAGLGNPYFPASMFAIPISIAIHKLQLSR